MHSNRPSMRTLLRSTFFWAFTLLSLLFAAVLSIASFDEWLTVAVHGQTGGYPWGIVNETPWYYRTPATYAGVMLMESVILIIAIGLTIYLIIRRNKETILYGLLGLWLLISIIFVNGHIQ